VITQLKFAKATSIKGLHFEPGKVYSETSAKRIAWMRAAGAVLVQIVDDGHAVKVQQPPVDNDHVAPGSALFDSATIAMNATSSGEGAVDVPPWNPGEKPTLEQFVEHYAGAKTKKEILEDPPAGLELDPRLNKVELLTAIYKHVEEQKPSE
jgi:hypothetical protein